MKSQFLTDRGQIRSVNEDAGGIYFNRANQLLAIVADGMGGHQAGEVASEMATDIVREAWESSEQFTAAERVEQWLSEVIENMNRSIYEYSSENEQYEGMGTTIVITVCTDDFTTIAHIGDSRCYLLNERGFTQMTEDHSLVNELVRSGEISKGDAQSHPRKNILLKALGTEQSVRADIKSISWENDNKLLLCSDGLTNELSDEELVEHLERDESLEQIANELLSLANDRGGEDNITLAIIEKVSETEVTEKGDDLC